MIAAVLCVVVELFESAFSRHFLDVDAESLRDFAAADAFLVELKCDLVAFVACCFDAGIKDDPLDCHVLDTAFAFSERSGGVADGLPGCCFCHGCTHSSDHNPRGCVRPSRPHTTMAHKPVRRRVHGFVMAGLLRMTGPSRPDHPPRGADLAARMLSCRGASRGGCAAHRGRHNHFQLYPLLTEQVQLSKCLKLGGSSRFGKSLSLGHASRVQDGWNGDLNHMSIFFVMA